MNQKASTIRLREHMDREDGWGRDEGAEVARRLETVLDRDRNTVYRVSLEGIRRTDASFPRESVLHLARMLRGTVVFCLVDVDDPDILDNWNAAALVQDQPLLAWLKTGHRILGPQPSDGLLGVFNLMVECGATTTGEAASRLGLNVPNVSNKLKALWEQGYTLRSERVAASGGIEYEYSVAR